MNLEVKYVSEVNAMVGQDGIPLVRKAMIRCGLALITNSCCEITRLFEHLQDVIQRCHIEFLKSSVQLTNFKFVILSSYLVQHPNTKLEHKRRL